MRPAAVIDVICMCKKTHTSTYRCISTEGNNHCSPFCEIYEPQVAVNEPHCFQYLSGGVHSASIGVSDSIASSRRRLSQPVPLTARVLILNIELLNMPAFRLDRPLFLQSDSTVITLIPHGHSHSIAIHHRNHKRYTKQRGEGR